MDRSFTETVIPARQALLFQGGIGVIGLIAIYLLDIPVLTGGMPWVDAILWGAAGSMATFGVLLILVLLPGRQQASLKQQMRYLQAFAKGFSWRVLIGLCVLAGVGEELLFRGAIQGGLATQLNPVTALAVASVLFGLVHYLSFTYFIVATFLGALLGTAYMISESILLVMVWHGVYDLVALYFLVNFYHRFQD